MYPLGALPSLGTITSVKTEGSGVALTFDDGPDPKWTPILLDLLKAHDAKATFFVVGKSCKEYPWIIQRAASEGHALCNHGWSHKSLPFLPMSEQVQEIRRCEEALGEMGSRLFRPPYGHQSIRSRWSARITSQQVVAWSAHIADWRQQSPRQLYRKLLDELTPGAIILLHDTIMVGDGDVTPGSDLQCDRSGVFEAIDMVLSECAGNYDFITLPDLIKRGVPRRESWFYHSRDVS